MFLQEFIVFSQELTIGQLLAFVSSDSYRTRAVVARALKDFDDPQAKAALSYLRKDENPQVVAAASEGINN